MYTCAWLSHVIDFSSGLFLLKNVLTCIGKLKFITVFSLSAFLMFLYIKLVYFAIDLYIIIIYTMLFVSMLCLCVDDTVYFNYLFVSCIVCFNQLLILFLCSDCFCL